MVRLKCPGCQSELEIDENKTEFDDKIGVFCSDEKCTYHKNPLVGIDRKEPGVYISEALV